MKFLFASDSFKGTLSSNTTAQLLYRAANHVFTEPICRSMIIADGGEGTMEAFVDAIGGTVKTIEVEDALGNIIEASYAILNNGYALIEMAKASGLTLIPQHKRDIMTASTYGTGQIILDAINNGCQKFIIAIGGSATNDGGLGCLRALGAKLFDINNEQLSGSGKDLIRLSRIDTTNLLPNIHDKEFIVMCDVDNPLCGTCGATHTFAKQKGASSTEIELLEKGMLNYRRVLMRDFHIDPNDIAGTGAAGGLGTALIVVMNGIKQSGIETLLKATDFDNIIKDIDYVITGEGQLDEQSLCGKVISGICNHCKCQNIPIIALVGNKGDGWEKVLSHGVKEVFAITDNYSLYESLSKPEETYYNTAIKMFSSFK